VERLSFSCAFEKAMLEKMSESVFVLSFISAACANEQPAMSDFSGHVLVHHADAI
jgi:hypothetical protein